MADQKRWFKVWTSILVDMDHRPDDEVGRWVRLGARIALVGSRGSVSFESWEHLASFLHVTVDLARATLERLPGVSVKPPDNGHGKITVTMENWQRYQEDTTGVERKRRSRVQRRGEEIRGESIRQDGIFVTEPEGGETSEPEPVREFFGAWIAGFEREVGQKPELNRGKVAGIAKRVTDQVPMERVRPLLDAFFADKYARSCNYSIDLFAADLSRWQVAPAQGGAYSGMGDDEKRRRDRAARESGFRDHQHYMDTILRRGSQG